MGEKRQFIRDTVKEFIDGALETFGVDSKTKISEFEATGKSVLASLSAKETEELAKAAAALKAIEEQKVKIDALNQQAVVAMADISAKKIEVDKVAAVSATTTTELAKNRAVLEALLKDYRDSLDALTASSGLALKTIEEEIASDTKKARSFLKVATVATLAHTFSQRKTGANATSWIWSTVLFAAFSAAIAIALISEQFGVAAISAALKTVPGDGGGSSWFNLIEIFLVRLPVFGPLVWLIYIASSRSGFYARLADDYAHKQSVMTIFEGYSKVLDGVNVTVRDEVKKIDVEKPALEVLVRQTLETINKEPERIHEVYVPPKAPFDDAINKLSDVVQALAAKSSEGPGAVPSKWVIAGISAAAVLIVVTALKVFIGSH